VLHFARCSCSRSTSCCFPLNSCHLNSIRQGNKNVTQLDFSSQEDCIGVGSEPRAVHFYRNDPMWRNWHPCHRIVPRAPSRSRCKYLFGTRRSPVHPRSPEQPMPSHSQGYTHLRRLQYGASRNINATGEDLHEQPWKETYSL